MRGRKPIPTSIKLLNGNPGKRKLYPENEPQMPPLDADAESKVPTELADDPVATAEWQRLIPLLRAARCVTEAERSLCIAVCQEWSAYLSARQEVSRQGAVILSQAGYPVANPYASIATRALTHCTKLWVELGLTPSARSRVKTVGPPIKSAVDVERDGYFGTGRGA
jgi:P27 family predicted phage terminase small subunit